MTQRAATYLHGTSPEEQRRLADLNALLNEACLAHLSLTGTERVLDVGSGLGQLTRAIARRLSGGSVVGVERSEAQLLEARRYAAKAGEENLVDWRQGDAYALPLEDDEWAQFDLAHARFVLEHVPDPLRVVKEMTRAVRPGGRVILFDDDHETLRAWPEPPGFPGLWSAYMRTYDRLGNDPNVGRRLVSLLHQAGATDFRSGCVFFGGCAGNDRFRALVENMLGIFAGAKDAMVSHGLIDPDVYEESIAGFQRWAKRPEATVWYQLPWAEGRRRT
jgi:SAM-dependent methyltransferase